MTQTQDFLVEIGTEELPPKALQQLSHAFCQGISQGLDAAGLRYSALQTFATPRRLAVRVHQLITQQAPRAIERKGPALHAAFDAQNRPTPACLGFARSCGVTADALQRVETPQGGWVAYQQTLPGQATVDLLPEIISHSLKQIPIPKPMRWGTLKVEFVRPIQWILVLWGTDALNTIIFDMPTSNHSYGHRFHHPQALPIPTPQAYEETLYKAYVIADFVQRRQVIEQQIHAAAATRAGTAVIDPALLNEVTSIVEWPVAQSCAFAERFLTVPKEALISAMQGHQKCFPIVDAQQHLLPYFITICNIESHDPTEVIKGNQRVMHARLSDAVFFYDTDRKQSLSARVPQLARILFQAKLGSLADKAQRIAELAKYMAVQLHQETALAERAGLLCKADLVTQMVGEFPELQGIMGKYYALHDGESAVVAHALSEHYLPRFAGDKVPASQLGAIIAIADRVDSLIGIFGIEQAPSGDKDPFALRRAALGIVRICIEKFLALPLMPLLAHAAGQYPTLNNTQAASEVWQFIHERLKAWYLEQGIKADTFAAVFARRPVDLLDFHQRINALQAFRQLPAAKALAAANKRVKNILDKQTDTVPAALQDNLLQHPAEHALAQAVQRKAPQIEHLVQRADYNAVLTALADLNAPLEQFFADVMVMVDDPALRTNRLALLTQLRQLFLNVADISLLHD